MPIVGSESLRRSVCEKWEKVWTKRALMGLVLGQIVSLLITSTGFSSSELARRGVNAPTSQSFLNYLLLATFYGAFVIRRKRPLQLSWYYYLVLAVVDVEANVIVVKAYQYTSLTSVMLLDCWSIPCVILFTWVFLKTKYGFRKFAGVAICVAGLVMVVFSDVHASDRAEGGPNPVKGDIFVIVGSTLYAVSNVGEEFIIKKADRVELMAMLGAFGAVVSAIQIILECSELKDIKWTAGAVLPFLGFAMAMFLFYSTVPVILKICGATLLNLSLLTSDMWAVLIRIFAYHQKVDWMYFIAFAAVAVGLVIYSVQRKKDEEGAQVAEASDERQKEKDEEAVVLDNLTRGSIVAVEGQRSEDVKQQPSITSLPK
nr:PREDICTED: solute carrier family 35 member F1-like isoform X2 [Musa acuminata subsp. malaccensis]